MNRQDIYLQALSDYMATRDNYTVDTMVERCTGLGFCYYFQERIGGRSFYSEMDELLPELHSVLVKYANNACGSSVPYSKHGLEYVERRIEMLKQALAMLEQEAVSHG